MQSKSELLEHVREWVTIETKMKEKQREVREMRSRKKELTGLLVDVMKDNDIDSFNITNGSIVYKESKVRAPLSKKHLLTALSDYFKTDPSLSKELTDHILNTRATKSVESIEYKMNK
tara:strand:+ start:157 stop:510 length:354 start_codon:yes stop_codon:yes gene_type:complete